jgi:hypothetical protein
MILWCLERINDARFHEKSLDEKLLATLIGYDVVRWNLACGRLERTLGGQRFVLEDLAAWVEETGWRTDPRNARRQPPEHDFPAREDEVPIPKIL